MSKPALGLLLGGLLGLIDGLSALLYPAAASGAGGRRFKSGRPDHTYKIPETECAMMSI